MWIPQSRISCFLVGQCCNLSSINQWLTILAITITNHHHNHFLFVNHHHSGSSIIILAIIQSTWSSPWPFFQLSSTIMVANNRPNVWIRGNSPWYILISHVVEVLTNSLNMHASKTEWSNMNNIYLNSTTTISYRYCWVKKLSYPQPFLSQESIGCISNDSSGITSGLRTHRQHPWNPLWHLDSWRVEWISAIYPVLVCKFYQSRNCWWKTKKHAVYDQYFVSEKTSSATITLTFGWSVMTVPTCNVCKMIRYRVVRARTPATKHIVDVLKSSQELFVQN